MSPPQAISRGGVLRPPALPIRFTRAALPHSVRPLHLLCQPALPICVACVVSERCPSA